MRALFPPPLREFSPEELYLDLSLPDPPQDRPYVFINMVSSADGKAAVSGRVLGIGSRSDRRVMRNLRVLADAVMIGSGTLLAEKISLGVPEQLSQLRTSRGKSSQPLAVIMSRDKNLPLTNLVEPKPHNTFTSTTMLEEEAVEKRDLDLTKVLKVLRKYYSVSYLLVEGGPSINYSLLGANLVDEIFLTISPTIIGGPSTAPTIVGRSLNLPTEALGLRLELTSAAVIESELFLRYVLSRT